MFRILFFPTIYARRSQFRNGIKIASLPNKSFFYCRSFCSAVTSPRNRETAKKNSRMDSEPVVEVVASISPSPLHPPPVRRSWRAFVFKFLVVPLLIAAAVEHQFEGVGSESGFRPTNVLETIADSLRSVSEWLGYYFAWITDIYYFFKEYLLNYLRAAGNLLLGILGVVFSPIEGFATGIYKYCREYATPTVISVVSIALGILFLVLIVGCCFDLYGTRSRTRVAARQ